MLATTWATRSRELKPARESPVEPCIPVWLLEQARRLGTSEADLLRAHPTLRTQDLANAWAYVQSHREEIEQQIAEDESDESQ